MNTARVKLLVWGAACVIGAGVFGYVALFFVNREEYMRPVSTAHMGDVLGSVKDIPQHQENIVDKDLIERSKGFDWTGKPPPKPEERPVVDPNQAPVREQVASLIRVRGIRFDAESPDISEVVFKYTSEAKVVAPNNGDGTMLKRVGDVLDGRLNQIKIAKIYPDSVEFAFLNESDREHEFVGRAEYPWETGYVLLADGTEPTRRTDDIKNYVTRRADNSGPLLQTQRLAPTKFRIGTDDAKYFDENYPKILTEEVEIGQHRDPKTKKIDGIEIKKVAPDSIAARHGVESGDVIKSINGHPVASKDEAIMFVKNNKDKYTEWQVEVWNKGQTRTMTYYSPKK